LGLADAHAASNKRRPPVSRSSSTAPADPSACTALLSPSSCSAELPPSPRCLPPSPSLPSSPAGVPAAEVQRPAEAQPASPSSRFAATEVRCSNLHSPPDTRARLVHVRLSLPAGRCTMLPLSVAERATDESEKAPRAQCVWKRYAISQAPCERGQRRNARSKHGDQGKAKQSVERSPLATGKA
jgi:hypothetical protein